MSIELREFIEANIAEANEMFPLTNDERHYYEMGVYNVTKGGFPFPAHGLASCKSYYDAGETDGRRYLEKQK